MSKDEVSMLYLECEGPRSVAGPSLFVAFVKDNTATVLVIVPGTDGRPVILNQWEQNARYCPHDTLEGFMRAAGDNARLGWTAVEGTGYEAIIVHFYDATKPTGDEDDQAGLAWSMNLQYPYDSELGHAPFPHVGQTLDEYNKQIEDNYRGFMESFGGAEVHHIVVNQQVASGDPKEENRR